MSPLLNVAGRVRAGARHLDVLAVSDERLVGWRDRLDPDRLDMGSTADDILGQLGCTYTSIGLDLDRAITLGLEPSKDNPYHIGALTKGWRHYLTLPQAAERRGRRSFRYFLTPERHDTFLDFAAATGTTITGLLSALADELEEETRAAGAVSDVRPGWVQRARALDADARRRDRTRRRTS